MLFKQIIYSLLMVITCSPLIAMEQQQEYSESQALVIQKQQSNIVVDTYKALKQPSVIFLTQKGLDALGFGLIGLHQKFPHSDFLNTAAKYGGVALVLFVRHEALTKTIKQIGKMFDYAEDVQASENALGKISPASKSLLYGSSALACGTIAISAMPVLDTVGDMIAGGVISPIILCDTKECSIAEQLVRGGIVAFLIYNVGSYTLDQAKKAVDAQKSETPNILSKSYKYGVTAVHGTSAMLGCAIIVKSLGALAKHFEYLPIPTTK